MTRKLAIRPDPDSLTERGVSELVALLEEAGTVEPGEAPGGYRWRVSGAPLIAVGCDREGDTLQEVRLDIPGELPRSRALDLAAQLAGPLHWEIVEVDTGAKHTPQQVAEPARRSVRGRLSSGLAAISAAAAVLGGLVWRATGGGPSPWLLVAILGIGVYVSLRASSWVRSRMRAPRV